jgi:hypothetical protein
MQGISFFFSFLRWRTGVHRSSCMGDRRKRERKKTFTRGVIAWVKVLSAEICPGPGPFDRVDGNRVGLFGGR